jgi:hypothetical protein
MARLVPKVIATGSKKLRAVIFLETIFNLLHTNSFLNDKTAVVNKCET